MGGYVPMQCLECQEVHMFTRSRLVAQGVPICPNCRNRFLVESVKGASPMSKTQAVIVAQEPHTPGSVGGGGIGGRP